MKLDFSPTPLMTGKKTERITVTCSSDFKGLVDMICRFTGQSVSEIGHRYFIAGIQGDLGTLFMAEPHLDKKLTDLIKKNF